MKIKKDQTPASQGFLNEELETLYQKDPEKNDTDSGVTVDLSSESAIDRKQDYRSLMDRMGHAKTKDPGLRREKAFAKFLLYFVPGLLILSFALFVWPTFYQYSTLEQGGRSYLVKTNRLIGSKSYLYGGKWLNNPLPATMQALRIPDPLSITVPEEKTSPPQNNSAAAKPEKSEPEALPQPKVKDSASVSAATQPPRREAKSKGQSGKQKPYAVQIGAFQNEDEMNAFISEQNKPRALHWAKVKIGNQVWYRVFIGRFENQAAAKKYLQKSKMKARYPGSFVQKIVNSEW